MLRTSRWRVGFVLLALVLPGCGVATVGSGPAPAKSSAAVAVGGEPFSLYTHCGIHELTFGGRWYERVGGLLDDGSGNPPQGWGNPYQTFELRPGATSPIVVCS